MGGDQGRQSSESLREGERQGGQERLTRTSLRMDAGQLRDFTECYARH